MQGLENGFCVADVGLDEREHLRRKIFDPLLFDSAGIKGLEAINRGDAMTVTQEATAEMATDEASPAGDAEMHISFSVVRRLLPILCYFRTD
jgi:hypothetical protein